MSISSSFFKVLKIIRLNATRYFIMKTSDKRDLAHTNFKDFMRLILINYFYIFLFYHFQIFRQPNYKNTCFIIRKCYEILFFNWKTCFTRKRFARNSATIKGFQYLPLGSELKKQTGMSRKTVQKIRQHLWTSKNDYKRKRNSWKKFINSILIHDSKFFFFMNIIILTV